MKKDKNKKGSLRDLIDNEIESVAKEICDEYCKWPLLWDEESERHICPLQLDVIERCVKMYSKEGDTVFTPFMGIGSEVYQAVKMGRKGIGIELKREYFLQAKKNMQTLDDADKQITLFDYISNLTT